MVLIALIAVLLPALAILQYRWLGELSGLEQLRAQANIRAATARFSTEFDGQLAAVYAKLATLAVGAPASGELSELRDAVRSLTSSGLVKRLYVIDRGVAGTFSARELDANGREVADAEWPSWLGDRAGHAANDHSDAALPSGLRRTLLDDVPAIVARQSRGFPTDGSWEGGHDRWIIAELDLARIVNDLLPTMLAGCFEGGIPVGYDVLVIRDDMPNDIVYRSSPALARASFSESNTPMPVFAIHGRDMEPAAAQALLPDAAAHRWRMLIQPQSGALEAAVGAARSRNLAIGIGVLSLLAVSVVLLFASMRKAERAVRDQLELVARVSHELRTPLATITCAGENLADSVVPTPADARYYGQLIKREGRRLSRTLGDILLCCRLQARPDAVLNLQPTDVGGVIDRALADTLLVAADDGVRIDKAVEPRLPPVLADAEALRMALKNLLINGVKHGHGHPVRVSAKSRRTSLGAEVAITVEDDGPGIPADELAHVFEPFYRGRDARNREIEGSGIGLSIVRQVVVSHGGRIRVSSVGERGTRFVLQLPALRGATAQVDPAA